MAAEAVLEKESVALWREYRRTRDVGIRNSLVMRHMGLVHQIANRYAALARDSHEDLVQEACLGLIRAIERFQPDYGVQFSTYAYPVISGTVKNYLRERRRLLGQSRWEHGSWEERGSGRGEVAVAEGEELVAPEILEDFADQAGADFTDQVLSRMVTDDLVVRLPLLERKIVKHFFYDDLTQREVARIVARSTSRISRILRRALERIRGLLVDIQREEHRLGAPVRPQSLIVVPSVVDAETGLFGPEHLRRSLQREIGRAQALRAPLSLALVRPNGGIPVTPEILAESAKRIYRQVRVLDHVFRAGSSELALIFSLPLREAWRVCERFQNGASSLPLRCAIATYPQDATAASGLLQVAGARLNQS